MRGTQPWLMKDGVVNADGMQSEECRPSWLDAISQGGGDWKAQTGVGAMPSS